MAAKNAKFAKKEIGIVGATPSGCPLSFLHRDASLGAFAPWREIFRYLFCELFGPIALSTVEGCGQIPLLRFFILSSLTLGQEDRLELGFERGGHGQSFGEHLLQIAAGDRAHGHAGFLGFGDKLRIF